MEVNTNIVQKELHQHVSGTSTASCDANAALQALITWLSHSAAKAGPLTPLFTAP